MRSTERVHADKYLLGGYMNDSKVWLNYLRTLASHGLDISVYATQWAHDLRCLRTGADHRRVGAGSHGHDEWLRAGFSARQQPVRVPVRIR